MTFICDPTRPSCVLTQDLASTLPASPCHEVEQHAQAPVKSLPAIAINPAGCHTAAPPKPSLTRAPANISPVLATPGVSSSKGRDADRMLLSRALDDAGEHGFSQRVALEGGDGLSYKLANEIATALSRRARGMIPAHGLDPEINSELSTAAAVLNLVIASAAAQEPPVMKGAAPMLPAIDSMDRVVEPAGDAKAPLAQTAPVNLRSFVAIAAGIRQLQQVYVVARQGEHNYLRYGLTGKAVAGSEAPERSRDPAEQPTWGGPLHKAETELYTIQYNAAFPRGAIYPLDAELRLVDLPIYTIGRYSPAPLESLDKSAHDFVNKLVYATTDTLIDPPKAIDGFLNMLKSTQPLTIAGQAYDNFAHTTPALRFETVGTILSEVAFFVLTKKVSVAMVKGASSAAQVAAQAVVGAMQKGPSFVLAGVAADSAYLRGAVALGATGIAVAAVPVALAPLAMIASGKPPSPPNFGAGAHRGQPSSAQPASKAPASSSERVATGKVADAGVKAPSPAQSAIDAQVRENTRIMVERKQWIRKPVTQFRVLEDDIGGTHLKRARISGRAELVFQRPSGKLVNMGIFNEKGEEILVRSGRYRKPQPDLETRVFDLRRDDRVMSLRPSSERAKLCYSSIRSTDPVFNAIVEKTHAAFDDILRDISSPPFVSPP